MHSHKHVVANASLAAERGVRRQDGKITDARVVAQRRVVVEQRKTAERRRIGHDRIRANDRARPDMGGGGDNRGGVYQREKLSIPCE